MIFFQKWLQKHNGQFFSINLFILDTNYAGFYLYLLTFSPIRKSTPCPIVKSFAPVNTPSIYIVLYSNPLSVTTEKQDMKKIVIDQNCLYFISLYKL